VPYYQALQADTHLPPDAFKDQIVIVGREVKATSDQGMAQSDLFATPFTAHTGWLTPGAEIHANILETAIRGDALSPAPRPWSPALVIAVTALCAILMRHWRPIVSGAVALGAIVLLALADWLLFTRANIWLPVFAAMSSAAGVYVAFGGAAFLTERRR